MALVAMAALIPALALVGTSIYLSRQVQAVDERQSNATLDLGINLEQSLIDASLTHVRNLALSTAARREVSAALTGQATAMDALQSMQRIFSVADMIVLVDTQGVVRGRANTADVGDRLSLQGLLAASMSSGTAEAYPEIIGQAELAHEGDRLLRQVAIPVVPTEGASPGRSGKTLGDALALVGVAPVRDEGGKVLGAVLVAHVLNNNFDLVEEVARRSPAGVQLYASIATGDGVRVTTNVPTKGGADRAVGTLYSDQVMQSLRQGQEYRGRALVGGWQWQRTIYVPLRDHRGQVVAAPFVGIPESYFTSLQGAVHQVIWIGGLVALITLMVTLALAGYFGRVRITRPVANFTQLLREGDLNTVITPHEEDEIGELASALQAMVGRIRTTVAEMSHVASGVQAMGSRLLDAAGRTAADAAGALQVASTSLGAAERVGEAARQTAGRLRELEVALVQMAAGSAEQDRATRYTRGVTAEISTSLRTTQEGLTQLTGHGRASYTNAHQSRRVALRTQSVLELARASLHDVGMALQGLQVQLQSGAAGGPGDMAAGEARVPLAAGEVAVNRTLAEIKAAVDLADETATSLQGMAEGTEASLELVWNLAATMNENIAKAAAITQQMDEVSQVASRADAVTQQMGQTSQAVIRQVEGMVEGVQQAVVNVREARAYLGRISDANQSLLGLAQEMQEVVVELHHATDRFRQKGAALPDQAGE